MASWPAQLYWLLGLAAVMDAVVAIALGSACGSSTSPSLHPLIISIGLGFLAAALLCTIAAACWCLQQPVRLRALPAVLLAALLSARAGTALAHQVWWNDCSPPDGSTTLLLAAAPALAGAASLCLVLSEQPHKLALGAIQAADGASMLAYYFSFVTPFGPLSLTIILICGGVLGLAGWPTMWLLLSEYLPAALLPYLDTWARDGLVADGLEALEALQVLANRAQVIPVALGMVVFELWMFGLVCKIRFGTHG